MRKLAIAVLLFRLGCPSPGLADSPRITWFAGETDHGSLSLLENVTIQWTNQQTSGYCCVQWTSDLSWEWLPISEETWGLAVTSEVCVVTQLFASAFMNILADIASMTQRLQRLRCNPEQGLYARVNWSSNGFAPPRTVNSVRVQNLSSAPLTDVAFYTGDTSSWWPADVLVTNVGTIPAGDATEYLHVGFEWFGGGNAVTLSDGALMVSGPYKVTYWLGGTNYSFTCPVIPLGPAEKRITLIVSNDTQLLWAEWLGPPVVWYDSP